MQIKSALTGSGGSEMELYRGRIGGIVDHRQLRSGQIPVRTCSKNADTFAEPQRRSGRISRHSRVCSSDSAPASFGHHGFVR